MTLQITNESTREELGNAIANVKSFIQGMGEHLPAGTVVKELSSGNIGIISGVVALEEMDQGWSYCVLWVMQSGDIAQSNDEVDEYWCDANQIEVVNQEKNDGGQAD